jgi:hypothetical protein
MAHGKRLIPGKDAEYDVFFKGVVDYVVLKTGRSEWTHIPSAEVTKLSAAYTDWHTFYEITLGIHTKVDTAAKNEARKRSQAVLQSFIQTWFRGFPEVVKHEDLTAMDIPIIDSTRTPIGEPKTVPVFRLVTKGPGHLTAPFSDETTPDSRARPYGMNGAVVSLTVADHPVTEVKELTRTELATRSPHQLYFDAGDRGKIVSVAMQWQSESGVRGKFTEIQSEIIP